METRIHRIHLSTQWKGIFTTDPRSATAALEHPGAAPTSTTCGAAPPPGQDWTAHVSPNQAVYSTLAVISEKRETRGRRKFKWTPQSNTAAADIRIDRETSHRRPASFRRSRRRRTGDHSPAVDPGNGRRAAGGNQPVPPAARSRPTVTPGDHPNAETNTTKEIESDAGVPARMSPAGVRLRRGGSRPSRRDRRRPAPRRPGRPRRSVRRRPDGPRRGRTRARRPPEARSAPRGGRPTPSAR